MKKPRSRVTTDGLDRAPHRAFMRAMGLDDAAIAKPMIGVVSMKGEQTPCNMTHDFQVDAAKAGITEAGGTPREFTTISVSDGISMNHEGMKFSLVSRELIADSIEAVVHGLAYDALIGFGGCDKTLPGVMMGMIRCNVPSIFIYGGSALPGRFEGKTLTVLDSYEAVGGFMTGEIDAATLEGIERVCLPTIGACAGQFTANTMAMVSEAMGLTMPNVSMVPGVYAERAQIRAQAGRLVMAMLERRRTAAARDRDAQGARERRRHRRRHRRFDQRRAASAGARQRGRHPLHARRRRRGVRAHAADRQPAPRRQIHRQGCLRHRRHRGGDPRAGRKRPHRRLLPDGSSGRTIADEYGGANAPDGEIIFSTAQADHARRRRRRAEGQSLPRRRRHQGRRPEEPGVRRNGARLRGRGTLRRRRPQNANTRRAMFSSSATKARSAAPACARCSASPR